MRTLCIALSVLAMLAAASHSSPLSAQVGNPEVVAHLDAARMAAADDHARMYGILCSVPLSAMGVEPVTDDVPTAFPTIDPDRPWHTNPAQVFDNLYFVGQTGFSAWALETSEGIIVFDAIFDYSVEAQVIEGLRTLGLDPDAIRYVVIGHAHGDHSGGAAILQQRGARIVMSDTDWTLYENSGAEVKATRDVVATDGMTLTLGDTSIRTYITPGHTFGTISSLIPVRDGTQEHVAALWGGTLFNFRGTPENPRERSLSLYSESAARFGDIARDAGADVFLSNHTQYDASTVKIPLLAERTAGDPHPYVIGTDAVRRFFVVAEQCAIATRIVEEAAAP